MFQHRQIYGDTLTDQTAAESSAWQLKNEDMHRAIVIARARYISLPSASAYSDGIGDYALTGFDRTKPIYRSTLNMGSSRFAVGEGLKSS